MELTWLECLIFGLISGFSEFLPLSSVAHQTIFMKLTGGGEAPFLRFCGSLGCLVALLVVFVPALLRMRRERMIAAIPKSRRRRQPDLDALTQSRVLRMAGISALVIFVAYSLVWNLYQRLWILAGAMVLNGIALFLPTYLPGANKGARSMSNLDAMIIGIFAGLGIIPGLSGVGCGIAAARIRGADRRYATDLALMIGIPVLVALSVIRFFGSVGATAWSATTVLYGFTVLVASFGTGYLAIHLLRYLSVKTENVGFAYYCWGAALFTLLLYLI